MAEFLDSLNKEQRAAVQQIDGPLLIMAGAGSGKTKALTCRIAYMLEKGIDPHKILAITFTNKAAQEMRERVHNLVGSEAEYIWMYTFHSFGARFLRREIQNYPPYTSQFTIYDSDDTKQLIKNILKEMNLDDKQFQPNAVAGHISSAKNRLLGPAAYRKAVGDNFFAQRIADIYDRYDAAMKRNNALDFDDLLLVTTELLKKKEIREKWQNRFHYILIDEYQDTNHAQYLMARYIAGNRQNICAVGDADQSIYSWRGADLRNILDFQKDYPDAKIIKLEQNYRSTKVILQAANEVIKNNLDRPSKRLWTQNEKGALIQHFEAVDEHEEANYIVSSMKKNHEQNRVPYGNMAILYRMNAQSRILEERFIMEGIPYDVVGGVNFYSRREIKDMLAYLKTIDNGRDDLAVKRIINVPRRGIGATTILRVQEYADARGLSFYDALREADQILSIGKSAAKLKPFVMMIQSFRSKLEYYSLQELMNDIIETTGYVKELQESDEEDAEDRIQNIDELVSKVVAYEDSHDDPSLSEFLEEVALVADIDGVDAEDNRVLLMTLHSAKGLEFPHVYLAGLEDGVFPSYMTITSDDPSAVEEERRLAYVGITRAKEDLTITCAKQRMLRGETQYNPVSRFVREVPGELLDNKPQIFKKKTDFEEYRETPESRARFQTAPYGGNYAGAPSQAADWRPKAVVKPKRTDPENKPFIAQGIGSLAGVAGLSKGAGTKQASLEYGIGDRVRHIKYGEGTVLNIVDGPRDYQVTVLFDKAGQKIMYAAFAKLKKI